MSTPILQLAMASLWNRRVTAGLTIIAIAFSVTLLLGVEKIRRDAKGAFASTISGTDLIVGARTGAVQLLLYSVFRIGDATNNVSWQSYREISTHKQVRWSVPLSLGDSHRGFRVLGTTPEFFEHYRYARKQKLAFRVGGPFNSHSGAVVGAAVAAELDYQAGQNIVVAHGTGALTVSTHDAHPVSIVGVLESTGTPVDRTVFVTLQAITMMHAGSATNRLEQPSRDSMRQLFQKPEDRDLTPQSITAFMLGVRSKIGIFRLQRTINQYTSEPLLAILPGVALQQLWDLMSFAERLLRIISVMVVATGLVGMLTIILASLESRRREMAVLRSVGARPIHVFLLFMSEAGTLALAGSALGLGLLYLVLALSQSIASQSLGLFIPITLPGLNDWLILGAVVASGCAIGAIPAIRAYRMSLADGLSMRV